MKDQIILNEEWSHQLIGEYSHRGNSKLEKPLDVFLNSWGYLKGFPEIATSKVNG